MHIDAEHADARRWQLITINGDEYDGTSVTAAGMVYPHIVHLYSASFDYNGVHARTFGEVRALQPIGLLGSLHFDAQPPGQPAWTVNARINGDLARLALDADITEPFAAAFHGEIRDLTSHWRWRGQAQVRQFELAAWNAGNALGVITASLALEGDHDGFSAQGSVDPPGLHAGPLEADFSGRYKARVLTVSRLRLRHATSGAIADAQGSVTLVAGGPLLDLRGEWTQFRWPLAAAEAPLHSARGNYTLQGLRPYAIGAQGELQAGGAAGAAGGVARAICTRCLQRRQRRRRRAGCTLTAVRRAALGARALLAAAWPHQRPGYRAAASGHRRPAQFRPQRGRARLQRPQRSRCQLERAVGNAARPARPGHAELAHHGGDWLFRDVDLQLGATHIALDGRAGKSGGPEFHARRGGSGDCCTPAPTGGCRRTAGCTGIGRI